MLGLEPCLRFDCVATARRAKLFAAVRKRHSLGDSGMVEPKSEEEQYNKWKLLIPYLYDWFANHNLTWPSLSCR